MEAGCDMDAIERGASLEQLVDRRAEVRNQLADAWQRQKPVSAIRRLEQALIAIWRAIDEAEAPTQRSATAHTAVPT